MKQSEVSDLNGNQKDVKQCDPKEKVLWIDHFQRAKISNAIKRQQNTDANTPAAAAVVVNRRHF